MDYQPGPLARRKPTPPKMAPMPEQKPEVKKQEPTPKKIKPKKKPHKNLKMFTDFDEREFHPSVEIAWVDGVLYQCWRHHWDDTPEWRIVPNIQLP